MVKIAFTPTFCSFSVSDPAVDELLYTNLAFHPEGYFFSEKYQSRKWDGYNRLYNATKKTFRTGLLSRVLELLVANSVDFEVVGMPESGKYIQHSYTYELRPYQLRVVQDIVQKRFGIIQAPPRSGKTNCVVAVVDSERQFPVVFFCRSLDLAYQTKKRFENFLPDVPVGIVGDGTVDVQDVAIVTIQSAFSAYDKKYKDDSVQEEKPVQDKLLVKKLLKTAKLVFYDENHHSGASTSRFILDQCTSATMRIGLSATPFAGKEEDLLIEEACGPVIHSISYSELIKEGFLLRPNIYLYKLPKMEVKGNYQSVYKQAVTDNEFLAQLIQKIAGKLNSTGESVVVQTEFINHTRKLGELLGCPTMTGTDSSDYRKELLQKLQNKEVLCVVSTLFEEGLDLPSLGYTINAAGGLSSISTMQRMRSITAAEGKTTCGVIDFIHQCEYLSKHSKKRKKLYESEPEFNVEVRDVSKKSIEEIK